MAKSGRPRYFDFTPYYVAKAGTVALTESLALELAKDEILVNAVAPGPIIAPSGSSEEEIEEEEEEEEEFEDVEDIEEIEEEEDLGETEYESQ